MTPRRRSEDDRIAGPDLLWKELIRRFFPRFVQFCKPDLFRAMAPDRTEFLDKELASITGARKKGIVDVLAKVHLKNGALEFVLFHIEVQGYPDRDFPERMFRYFLRIWDRYNRPMTSVAVITPGVGRAAVESVFGFQSFGTEVHYQYNVFDIRNLDYRRCIASANPVTVAAGILAPGKPVPAWKRKYEVVRGLARLGLTSEEIHLLLTFVDRFSPLKPEEEKAFLSQVKAKEEKMARIMTFREEDAWRKGIQAGREKGIEKGIEKGKAEGKAEGREEGREEEKEVIARAMKAKGFSAPEIAEITGLSREYVEKL